MYEKFSIKNYRGFRNFEISDFKRVNLIAGMNNSGKTSLLEALFIHAGKNNPELMLAVNVFRGMGNIKITLHDWSEMPWESLFYNKNPNESIELRARVNGKESRLIITTKAPQSFKYGSSAKAARLEMGTSTISSKRSESRVLHFHESVGKRGEDNYLQFTADGLEVGKPPNPDFPGFFIYSRRGQAVSEDAELFGKIDVLDQLDDIVNCLKIIEPRLTRLSTVYVNDMPIIHGDIGLEKLLPLSYMGEGMTRLTSFLLRLFDAKNGVVFIDEIENGFHYSIMEQIWGAINNISKKYNVQVFATTHSYECVKSAHKAFLNEAEYDFCYYRLDRFEEEITAASYTKDALNYALKTDIEVR